MFRVGNSRVPSIKSTDARNSTNEANFKLSSIFWAKFDLLSQSCPALTAELVGGKILGSTTPTANHPRS